MSVSVAETAGVGYDGYSEEAFDHLDDTGIFTAAEIRAKLTGILDPAELPDLTPAPAQEHVCDGGDGCYPGGRPDGAQACRPLDETERARLSRGYALASAVLSGAVDYHSLPVIE